MDTITKNWKEKLVDMIADDYDRFRELFEHPDKLVLFVERMVCFLAMCFLLWTIWKLVIMYLGFR